MSTEIVFEAQKLRVSAPQSDGSELEIVKGVDFQVPKGKVVALIGESGSGKTTISLSSLGYCKPGLKFSGGQARLLGDDLCQKSTSELRPLRGRKVAYLAQSAAATFNPSIKINEQVVEASVTRNLMSRKEADARALELYKSLDLPNPETIGDRYPHQVSGGQLQRLMAAMALCGKPDLLVLDEPTTALDVTTQIEVLKAFKKVIHEEGAAAIYVSHDLAVVAQIADYIVVLYGGEVMERGPAEAIINNPKHSYTRRLMAAANPWNADAAAEDTQRANEKKEDVATMLDVSAGYGKTWNGKPAVNVLDNINFTVPKRSTVGVIGESGSGKSTLARVYAGLLPPSEGSLLLNGREIEPSYRRRSIDQLRRVQFVYQMADTALNPRQRVGDIIGRPLEFYLGLKGKKKRSRVNELLQLVDLTPEFASRYPDALSGGQKQRVNLARSLAADPEIILCDEVTSALDTIVGGNVIALLKRLQREIGVSIVFISHDLSTVASLASDVVVMNKGQIVENGPTRQILKRPQHPYTKLLISSVPEMRLGWLEETVSARLKQAAPHVPEG
ncbi:MAG: ABC transporter ATP-binding protein [Roseibium sp.]|uniref:ABC transporter ATP-binding protein n=1 Tax=Roseibium sp. TaxID=1936156 RepID=UPI003D9C60BC